MCIEPDGDADLDRLCAWLRARPDWVQERLTEHGALLFRGFPIAAPADFERLARAIDDELNNEYLGTSPRNGLTDYIFTASELPPFFPIPQNCEMTFVAHPPRRVFFCCLVAPAPGSGETPLVDFRAVWRDLDPAVQARFAQGGIRIVRNYILRVANRGYARCTSNNALYAFSSRLGMKGGGAPHTVQEVTAG